MTKVTADMTITLDGYASGLEQSREKPFGTLDHRRLHHCMFEHREDNLEEAEKITTVQLAIDYAKAHAKA